MDSKQGDIIQAVEQCLRRNGCSRCENCPYTYVGDGFECREKLRDDIIALLKAQEPKPPLVTENAYGWKFYHCPSCGREFYGDRMHGRMNKTAFCDKCGQAVKWNDD